MALVVRTDRIQSWLLSEKLKNRHIKAFLGDDMTTVVTIEELVKAYHALIDHEYKMYEQAGKRLDAVKTEKEQACRVIMVTLDCDMKKAERILHILNDRGYIIWLGDATLRTIHMDLAYRISNIRVAYGGTRYPLETRMIIKSEELPRFDDVSFEKLLEIIRDEKIYNALKYALYRDPKSGGFGEIRGFSIFQWKAIRKILNGGKKAFVLVAPTAGGKTYAFLIPALVLILRDKMAGGADRSVKALFIYPRKTLEHDQLNKMISIIYRLNRYLKQLGLDEVTIGIDDGLTPWEDRVDSGKPFRGITCPACGVDREGGELSYMKSSGGIMIWCKNCGKVFKWIYGYREQVWEKKPDILITNVWTLDWRLPSTTIEHRYNVYKGLKVIVLDEAHAYQSLLGGNVRYLIKRLRIASESDPIVILSSATIYDPKKFAIDLLDLRPHIEFEVITSPEGEKKKKVIYLIMAVHPLRSWETVVYELAILLGTLFYYREFQSVIFIDSIRELYRILRQTRVAMLHYGEPKDHFALKSVSDPNDSYAYWVYRREGKRFDLNKTPVEIFELIQIHHSGIPRRERVERDFAEGRLGVLISTSTLELGVDYPNVSIVATVGIPFMLESIPQRIGRAGRNAERTLNTTLAIILLRNTPLELYYLFNPSDLIEGFRKRPIPVAWKNLAIKRYHALSTVMDCMAKNGKNTCILRGDGELPDLKEFVDELLACYERYKSVLQELNSRVLPDELYLSEAVESIKLELSSLPEHIDAMRRTHSELIYACELLTSIRDALSRAFHILKRVGDAQAINIAKQLRRVLREAGV